jgi:hypothetical protein
MDSGPSVARYLQKSFAFCFGEAHTKLGVVPTCCLKQQGLQLGVVPSSKVCNAYVLRMHV